ncbi:hypothetical protein [Amycolatopsis sp. cmx-11-12]|uniref:hypothetical protein n=1 Tax=Amycolatopsis sp. cmx-11-12 TaxID=2785795 RepID=UPI0039174344
MNPLTNLTFLFFLFLTFVALGYTWSCAVFPYKACRSCRGVGFFRSPVFRAIRLCRRCDGSGRTLRAGRRAYNSLLRARRSFRDAQERNRRNDDH